MYREKRDLGLQIGMPKEWIALSPDGNSLVVAGGYRERVVRSVGRAIVWDFDCNDVRADIELCDPTSTINSVAFTPNSQALVTGCSNGSVHFWKLKKP